jgi:hypothetical protein
MIKGGEKIIPKNSKNLMLSIKIYDAYPHWL